MVTNDYCITRKAKVTHKLISDTLKVKHVNTKTKDELRCYTVSKGKLISGSFVMKFYFKGTFKGSLLSALSERYLKLYLKPLKTQLGKVLFFPLNFRLIHLVFVLISAPNVRERFTKTLAQ